MVVFFSNMAMVVFHVMSDSGVIGVLRYMYIILHLLCVSYVTVPARVPELLECDCTGEELVQQLWYKNLR